MSAELQLLQQFEASALDPAGFSHRDHVRAAWALLGPEAAPFHQAYARYRAGLVALTQAAGVPEKYSETQTLGWLALVHDAVARTRETQVFERFESLAGLGSTALSERYGARLKAPEARTGLILP